MKLNRLIKRLAHAAGNQWRRATTVPKPETKWGRERLEMRNRQRQARKQLARLKALTNYAESCLKKWKSTSGGDLLLRGGHLWVMPGCNMVCLNITCGDKDSLADTVPAFVAEIVRPIADQYKPKGMEDSTTMSKLREYKYSTRDDDPLHFQVRVEWSHSARCELVPTGEFEERMVSGPSERQMVEIKKIVCNGEAV